MKWWLAEYNIGAKSQRAPTPVVIDKVTERFVVFPGGKKRLQTSGWKAYRSTKEEAVQWQRECLQHSLTAAMQRLDTALSDIDRLRKQLADLGLAVTP